MHVIALLNEQIAPPPLISKETMIFTKAAFVV